MIGSLLLNSPPLRTQRPGLLMLPSAVAASVERPFLCVLLSSAVQS
jgi:hypothetical protein